jgi:hypothetical protein
MQRSLFLPTAFMVLTLPATAMAANHAKVSPTELARAINLADRRSVPYRKGKISPSDILIIKCTGPDVEPTEFDCAWRQRTGRRWVGRKTWLAIDGSGWQVVD